MAHKHRFCLWISSSVSSAPLVHLTSTSNVSFRCQYSCCKAREFLQSPTIQPLCAILSGTHAKLNAMAALQIMFAFAESNHKRKLLLLILRAEMFCVRHVCCIFMDLSRLCLGLPLCGNVFFLFFLVVNCCMWCWVTILFVQVFTVACDLLTLLTLFSAELLVVLVVRCVVCLMLQILCVLLY